MPSLKAPFPEVLTRLGEHFAAGFLEDPWASPMLRWSRAVRRRFEHRTPTPYDGGPLYPCGRARSGLENQILFPCFSYTWGYNATRLEERLAEASPEDATALAALRQAMATELERRHVFTTPHTVGGAGYTHSIPNYGRVLAEGLDGHARRVANSLRKARASAHDKCVDFCLGLQDVLAGIRAWHANILAFLADFAPDTDEQRQNRDRLIAALQRVPFQPARSFYEAVVAYNFVYYLDDCDNPGRTDLELRPYYEADPAAPDEAPMLLERLADNVYRNWGWSQSVGGTAPDGSPAFNPLTEACIRGAIGKARPSVQLRVRRDMPDRLWDAAFDSLASGNGLPALYNEEGYLAALRDAGLGIAEADLAWWNGGGCTETMIHGRSNVGSLDAGLNMPLVLVESLDRHLAAAPSFEALLAAVKADLADTIAEVCRQVSLDQEAKARWRPQPMRSLLIDDCIDCGIEYRAGGARYNWSVVNVAGMANVADSLAAVREVVFEKGEATGAELLAALHADFEGCEPLRRRLQRCPRFGNDEPAVDAIAADVAEHVFREFLERRPWRGGRFLPSTIMFVTYTGAGARVGATPDGRRAGQPLADSIGPVQGRDRNGPTAMLASVAKLPLHLAPGTPILNARFSKQLFATAEGRARLRDLVRTYFDLGGLQVQVNVVDQEVLRDALEHPERHADLIIRVGGYCAHFVDLSRDLQESILERTEHGA